MTENTRGLGLQFVLQALFGSFVSLPRVGFVLTRLRVEKADVAARIEQ